MISWEKKEKISHHCTFDAWPQNFCCSCKCQKACDDCQKTFNVIMVLLPLPLPALASNLEYNLCSRLFFCILENSTKNDLNLNFSKKNYRAKIQSDNYTKNKDLTDHNARKFKVTLTRKIKI